MLFEIQYMCLCFNPPLYAGYNAWVMCFKRKRDTSGRLLLQNGQMTGRENHFTADVYIKSSCQRLRPDFGRVPPPPPGEPPGGPPPVLITRGGLRKVQKTANIRCNLQTCEFEDYTWKTIPNSRSRTSTFHPKSIKKALRHPQSIPKDLQRPPKGFSMDPKASQNQPDDPKMTTREPPRLPICPQTL